MKMVRQFLMGASIVVIAACGGSSGGGGDDGAAAAPAEIKPCGNAPFDLGTDPLGVAMIDGDLEAGDCLVVQIDETSENKSYADVYSFTVTKLGFVTIDLSSGVLDMAVALGDVPVQKPADTIITQDDDGAGGTDALLVSPQLMPGTYYIYVFEAIKVGSPTPMPGAYSLEVEWTEL